MKCSLNSKKKKKKNCKELGVGAQCNQKARQLDPSGQRINATSYSINRSTVLQVREIIVSLFSASLTCSFQFSGNDQRENLQEQYPTERWENNGDLTIC